MDKNYQIGIIIMIIASLFAAVGQYFFQLVSFQEDFLYLLYYYLFGLILYGMGFLCMMIAYRKLPLSIAHPLISFEYIFALFISFFLLNEIITGRKIVGILFIISGAYFLSLDLRS